MKNIEIYTKNYCPFCHRAINLLESKRVAFQEIDVTHDAERETEMRRRSGRTTVPEIFIDNQLIGGCDDLFSLENSGELDRLLADT